MHWIRDREIPSNPTKYSPFYAIISRRRHSLDASPRDPTIWPNLGNHHMPNLPLIIKSISRPAIGRDSETFDVLGPTIAFILPPEQEDDACCLMRATIAPGVFVPFTVTRTLRASSFFRENSRASFNPRPDFLGLAWNPEMFFMLRDGRNTPFATFPQSRPPYWLSRRPGWAASSER
jgi:hypothetical protein